MHSCGCFGPAKYLFEFSERNRTYVLLVVCGLRCAVCGVWCPQFDRSSGVELYAVKQAHRAVVTDMLLLDNGRWLVTCSADSIVRLWCVFALLPLLLLVGPLAARMTPDLSSFPTHESGEPLRTFSSWRLRPPQALAQSALTSPPNPHFTASLFCRSASNGGDRWMDGGMGLAFAVFFSFV
jgi:WD40 repeat protein